VQKILRRVVLIMAICVFSFSISLVSHAEMAEKVNINTATVKELRELDGIGRTLSRRIVKYRGENGPFKSVGELRDVNGLGKATFNKIEDKVVVGGEEATAETEQR